MIRQMIVYHATQRSVPMNVTAYYTLWAGMFILTAGLSFIPQPGGFLKFCLVLVSLGFFVPPACLLKDAEKRGDSMNIRIVRNLAFTSLVLTVVLVIGNFLTLRASEALGNVMYVLLCIATAPMVCSQYWALSLFGWACLMIWGHSLLKK